MDIGNKIKQLRTRQGLTLEELASRSELTKGFLSQLERDLTSPSIDSLSDILEALGTNLSEFFQEDKNDQFVFRAEDFFEHIYLSYEMKMAKPDADIFQKVLDETGILPNETLFIDDSEANCRTAEALGISTYTPKAHEDWRHAVVL